MHTLGSKVYSITNAKFIVETLCQRSCIFVYEMVFLYLARLIKWKIACSGLQSYMFGVMKTITLHIYSDRLDNADILRTFNIISGPDLKLQKAF